MIFSRIGILIRILQRNRTNSTYKKIYYRELAPVIMKMDKSQDVQVELER